MPRSNLATPGHRRPCCLRAHRPPASTSTCLSLPTAACGCARPTPTPAPVCCSWCSPDRMYWHVVADPVGGPWTVYGYAAIQPSLGNGAHASRHGQQPHPAGSISTVPPTSTLDLGTVSDPPGFWFSCMAASACTTTPHRARASTTCAWRPGTPLPVVAVGDVGNASVRLFPSTPRATLAPVAVLASAGTRSCRRAQPGLRQREPVRRQRQRRVDPARTPWGPLGDVAPVRTRTNTTLGGAASNWTAAAVRVLSTGPSASSTPWPPATRRRCAASTR